jgi:hypothetical protein
MMADSFTPYSTGASLFGQKPTWVSDELEQQRLQSYQLYEAIYWNNPGTFKLVQRGTNDQPIYVPSARTIVDTVNRYVAPGFSLNITARAEDGTPVEDSPDVLAARFAMQDFFKRERFEAKFSGAKRYCQIQGDWVWHLTADPTKPVGSRLSLNTLDPSMYFPQFDPNNIERIVAVFLAEPYTPEDGEPGVRRICYRKVPSGDTSKITVEEGIFESDTWESLTAAPRQVVRAVSDLPEDITSIPVYHIKGFEEPGNPWGSSEVRGFESLMTAINQTMSDEDLTLALEGIGMYHTTASHPVDPDTRKPVPWQLGPGRVVTHAEGTDWDRVEGARSVSPYGDHYDRLVTSMREAAATPDIAVGAVDVQIASSGIALALQLQPVLAKADEKNTLIIGTHNQMFYDILMMWYPAYEETVFAGIVVDCIVKSAVPIDREARFTELNDMLDRDVIDAEFYRSEASKLGYVFPPDIADRTAAIAAAKAQTQADAFSSRVNTELNSGSGGA